MEHAPKSTYDYRPLEHEDSIRLLELLPGAPEAPLTCKIVPSRISEEPVYEALSYVWGPQAFPKLITEIKHPADIPISTSLDGALRALRSEDKSRMLWVDAICINQHSLQERGHQVAQMGNIYRKATEVAVWLDTKDYSRIFEIFERIGNHFPLFGIPDFSFPTREEMGEIDVKILKSCASGVDWKLIKLFFDEEWFERAWTIQEWALANDLTFYTGMDRISYGTLMRAVVVAMHQCQGPRALQETIPEKERAYFAFAEAYILRAWYRFDLHESHKNKSRQTTFFALLQYTLDFDHCKCMDPRDRIYSILGVAEDKLRIIPDYTLSFKEVISEVVLKHILSSDSTLLEAAGLRPDSDRQDPSFLSNPGSPWNRLYGMNFFDSLKAEPAAVCKDTNTILKRTKELQTGSCSAEFRKTLAGPISIDRADPKSVIPMVCSYKESLEYYDYVLAFYIRHVLSGRHIFATDLVYLGAGPETTGGDQVVIFKGCYVSFVLRGVDKGSD